MDDANLRELVASGFTLTQIAARAGVHKSTVRARLRRLGIETTRMARLRIGEEARRSGAATLAGRCERHGDVALRRDARGTYRCPHCNAERVMARRRDVKAILVAEAGGACRLCGYDRCHRALEFHHLDPAVKEFAIGLRGITRSLERARAEAAKCVLLCSNCHVEVEAGVVALS
jgi:5-methylcytosine-specific restriction endonuclease McrA